MRFVGYRRRDRHVFHFEHRFVRCVCARRECIFRVRRYARAVRIFPAHKFITRLRRRRKRHTVPFDVRSAARHRAMRFVGYRHRDRHGSFAENRNNHHIAFGYKSVLCRRRQTVPRLIFPAHKRVPAVRRCRQGNRIAALHRRSAADRSVRRIVRRRRNGIRISRKFCRQRSISRHAECVFGTFGYRRTFRILPRNKAVVFVRRRAHRHFRTEYGRRRTRNRAHRIIVCRNGHIVRNRLKHRFERYFTAEHRKRIRRFFGYRGTACILPLHKRIVRLRRRSYRNRIAQRAGTAARHRAVCFVDRNCGHVRGAVIVCDRRKIDIPVHAFVDIRDADVV